MKKETGNKIRLGIFVTLGCLLLIGGIYMIGQGQHLFSNTFRISTMFKNVDGLQVGNNVRFAGINVGTVESIEIMNDTSVKVDVLIDAGTQKFIKKDSRAVIGSEGLMGNKIMNITPGTTGHAMIENNDYLATYTSISFDDILVKLKTTTDNAATLTGDLAAIISNLRSGRGTIGKLLMDSSIARNLNATMVNMKKGTNNFNENMEAAKNSFLLKGYFKNKEKEKEKERKKKEKEKEKQEGGKKKKKFLFW